MNSKQSSHSAYLCYRYTMIHYLSEAFDGMKIQLDGTDIYTVPNRKFLKYFEMLPVPTKIGRRVKLILVGSNRALVICEVAIYGGGYESPYC